MVREAFKEAGLQCYNKKFGLKQLYTTFKKCYITKAQEYEVSLKLKTKMYALLCSLVIT